MCEILPFYSPPVTEAISIRGVDATGLDVVLTPHHLFTLAQNETTSQQYIFIGSYLPKPTATSGEMVIDEQIVCVSPDDGIQHDCQSYASVDDAMVALVNDMFLVFYEPNSSSTLAFRQTFVYESLVSLHAGSVAMNEVWMAISSTDQMTTFVFQRVSITQGQSQWILWQSLSQQGHKIAFAPSTCSQKPSLVIATENTTDVYVYEYQPETNWTLAQSISILLFQNSTINQTVDDISMACDSFVVSNRQLRMNNITSGGVIVYTRISNVFTNFNYQLLDNTDPEPNEECGYSVSIHDETIVVGCPFFNRFNLDYGRVLRYFYNGETWELIAAYTDYNTGAFVQGFTGEFGTSVSTIDNIMLVGAPKAFSASSSGHVFLYHPVCLNADCPLGTACVSDPSFVVNFTCVNQTSPCLSNPCHNGGICLNSQDVLSYSCLCPLGFSGTFCQTDIDECASKPCLFGGTCVDQENGYTCLCSFGRGGSQCQFDIDACASNPCRNGGSCSFYDNATYSCVCLTDFNGVSCEKDMNSCRSNPCKNSALCLNQVNDYMCNCTSSLLFSGKNCEIVNMSQFWSTIVLTITIFLFVFGFIVFLCFVSPPASI